MTKTGPEIKPLVSKLYKYKFHYLGGGVRYYTLKNSEEKGKKQMKEGNSGLKLHPG